MRPSYGARYLRRPNRARRSRGSPATRSGCSRPDLSDCKGLRLFNGIRDARPMDGAVISCRKPLARKPYGVRLSVATGDHRVGALAFGPDPTGGPKRVAPWGEEETVGEHFDLAVLAEPPSAQSVDRLDLISGARLKPVLLSVAPGPRQLQHITECPGSQNSPQKTTPIPFAASSLQICGSQSTAV